MTYSFDMVNLMLAAPLLALVVGGTIILALDLVMDAKKAQPWWYVAGLGAVGLAAYYVMPLWSMGKATGWDGALINDRFSLVFGTIVLGATLFTLLLSVTRSERDQSGYLALVLFAAAGMMLLAGAGNLLTLFLGLEVFSLALYVVVGFAPHSHRAREAAFKYFALGAVAAGFLLFGFAFLYGSTGATGLADIAMAAGSKADDIMFKAGIGLTLVGFTFKLALVPFHVWAPDVYQGAPTAITAFMSVGTKTAAFAALARVLAAAVPAAGQEQYLFPVAVLGAASMLLGAIMALRQTNLKRLLAYSGISHAGYLMMALPGLTDEGFGAGAFYLIAYGIATVGLFGLIVASERKNSAGDELSAFSGLFWRSPAKGVAMTIFMFAMAGLPPTGGFIGKLMLGMSAVRGEAWLLLGALIVSTAISAAVYLKVVGTVFRKDAKLPAAEAPVTDEDALLLSPGTIRTALIAVVLVAAVGTVLLGVLPAPVTAFTQGLLGR